MVIRGSERPRHLLTRVLGANPQSSVRLGDRAGVLGLNDRCAEVGMIGPIRREYMGVQEKLRGWVMRLAPSDTFERGTPGRAWRLSRRPGLGRLTGWEALQAEVKRRDKGLRRDYFLR